MCRKVKKNFKSLQQAKHKNKSKDYHNFKKILLKNNNKINNNSSHKLKKFKDKIQ